MNMVSKTYISEIEISRVKAGQPVTVTLDAMPGKTFAGQVSSVANIGEQLPNSDSKVFEVLVKLNEDNHLLKPSMTSGNRIITKAYDDVVYVPLEALHTGSDNITYVYTKDGYRQVVIPGESNDKHIIIEKGVDAGRPLFLDTPGKADKFRLAGNELIPLITGRQLANSVILKGGVSEQGINGTVSRE